METFLRQSLRDVGVVITGLPQGVNPRHQFVVTLDIRLPPAFAAAYAGPRFGIAGTRRLAGLYGRPLVGTCPLYTSDAADALLRVDLGGRRLIQKQKH